MPAFIDLRAGMHVHVLPRDGSLSNAYDSVIRAVNEQGIRIDHPRQDTEAMTVAPGDEVDVYVQTGGRIYRLASRVRLVEQIPLEALVLEHPTEADHSERRQFYRLLTTISPRYAARVSADGEELERVEGRILDISGGGLQLQVRKWIPVGSRLRLIFALEDDPQEVDACATALSVVRPGSSHAAASYRVHCRYIDLPRTERERIVRFIFRKQIDFRKKGVA
jgi:c-di-GMP-binding flagellar brake protein YcgR